MLRSRSFWSMLAPSLGAVVLVGIATAVSSNVVGWLMLLLAVFLLVVHAFWLHRRVVVPMNTMVDAVNHLWQLGHPGSGEIIRPRHPSELASSLAEVTQDLSRSIAVNEQQDAERVQSEQLLQSLLRTMGEGVVAIDSEQRILFANAAARRLLDIDSPDALGRQLWEVTRSPGVQELVGNVLATREEQTTEFSIPRRRSIVAATATALPDNPVPGVLLMLQNVTELRRLEKLRQDFVSNVSHELKTPLTAIQAYADTLLDEETADAEQSRAFLERISEQAERLYELILDLLRLAKIESRPEAFELRAVDLSRVAIDCLAAQTSVARAGQLELSADGAEGPVYVRADGHELRTLLDNLVENSINYTPAGGRVVLRWWQEEELACLQVADTGIGIAKDQQVRIFERFYRADRARDRSRGGTGLGLAIVKHLVQLFGGSINVVSELGKGSTFTVTLPVADPSECEQPQSAGAGSHDAP